MRALEMIKYSKCMKLQNIKWERIGEACIGQFFLKSPKVVKQNTSTGSVSQSSKLWSSHRRIQEFNSEMIRGCNFRIS